MRACKTESPKIRLKITNFACSQMKLLIWFLLWEHAKLVIFILVFGTSVLHALIWWNKSDSFWHALRIGTTEHAISEIAWVLSSPCMLSVIPLLKWQRLLRVYNALLLRSKRSPKACKKSSRVHKRSLRACKRSPRAHKRLLRVRAGSLRVHNLWVINFQCNFGKISVCSCVGR